MSTSISTSVELQQTQSQRNITTNTRNGHDDIDSRDILEASLAADAEAPEGGYGWFVVAGCAVISFWFIGTSYSWGVIQAALVRDGLSSPSTLSFVGSLMPACISFLAILNARIVRRLGSRLTAMIGIFLLGLGGVLSGFLTESIGGLFVTAGVVMGIGLSLCFMVVSVTPAQYFKSKRGIANGIVFAGGGLGGTILSFAIDGLIRKLGTAWTFRVIGVLTWLSGLPAAWLVKERAPIRSSTFIEWRLFRDSRFSLLFVAGAVATFPLFVPPFFLPIYANSLGLSSSVGAGLVAAFNFSSAVGRLMCGFGSDAIGPVNTLLISLLMAALSMLVLWPISTSLAPMIIFVIINGVSNGGFFATMPTVVGNTFGSQRVSVAMGMIVSGWAGGYLLGAPIAGIILDASGGGGQNSTLNAFHPAIFYAGSVALSAAGLVAFIRLRMDIRLLKKV